MKTRLRDIIFDKLGRNHGQQEYTRTQFLRNASLSNHKSAPGLQKTRIGYTVHTNPVNTFCLTLPSTKHTNRPYGVTDGGHPSFQRTYRTSFPFWLTLLFLTLNSYQNRSSQHAILIYSILLK